MARRRSMAAQQPSLKTAREQDLMRRAGRAVALALAKVGEAIRPGITTGELDAIAEKAIRGLGAIPGFLGYQDYPATACISINDQVVHGIPGPRVLKAGDIVGIDLGAIVEGWNADAAFTFAVGEISAEAQRLLETGEAALAAAIDAAKPGQRVRDIGMAVQRFAEARGYGVVRDLCGHGIGRRLHEPPKVPNYATDSGDAFVMLQPGMALAIEPMLNMGRPEVELERDGWTFVTADGSLSVHFEHTVLIQETGAEIITTLR